MRLLIRKLSKVINVISAFDRKYQVTKNSASISFYMLISLISIFAIAIQIIALSATSLEAFLLPKVINVFTEKYSDILFSFLPDLSLSGFSILLFINILWSSSNMINVYNRMADYIYYKVKLRIGWKSRISAFLMFAMMIIVIIFELVLVYSFNYFLKNVLKIHIIFLIRLLQLIIEIMVIFVLILILYLYAPPIRMKVKNAYKGAIFSALLIYLVFAIFVLFITIMNKLGVAYTILSILSYSLLLIYVINIIIIVGMVINYHNGNIFQLKTSIFSKQ